jgi:general secretion pathway protein K
MNRDRGAAIILAMLIAALAAAVAVTVFADQQRWSRTVEHRRDQGAGAGARDGGRAMGATDPRRRRSPFRPRSPARAWAVPLPPIPLDNGEIRGAIVDAQGRLNINALGDSGTTAEIERRRIATLFAQRGGPVAALDAIADWIDTDAIVRESGAEDAFYAAQPVPGLPADAPFRSGCRAGAGKGRHAAIARCHRTVPVRVARGDARQRQHAPARSPRERSSMDSMPIDSPR